MAEVYSKDAADVAVDYHERGWSPIRLKGKVPAEPWAGYQHERMSRDDIEARPWPGVGIVTGAVSGIIVLDADSPEAEAELKRRGHPPTPTARTARGMHLYFKHPGSELPTRIALSQGLDLKGDGGYVAAPPTRHPSGTVYEWIISPEEAELADPPAWLIEQLRVHGRKMHAEDVGETITNGSRNKTLFSLACTLRRRGLDEPSIYAALLGINEAKCETPLDDDEVRKIAASAARYEPAHTTATASAPGPNGNGAGGAPTAASYNLTDRGNAERFVREHSGKVRYCYPWGKWLVWDGKRWRIDDSGEVERLMKGTLRGIYAEAADEEDDGRRKALSEHAKRSESKTRLTDALYLARSEPGVPVAPGQLDADPWVLNARNGTIDLRTGRLRDHRREDLITKLAPVDYAPDADALVWRAALERWLPSEALQRFVQRVAGYTLTGDVSEQVLPFLCGPGANGKTTFINTLLSAAGDYGQQAAPDLLLAKRGGHPTELADLFGARLVASVEVEDGRRLAESLVKQLTGGDRIKARRMREDFWEFDPTHKAVLVANHRPVVRGTDHAIWRRIKLVPFEVTIPKAEQDPRLQEKLKAELPGILAWAVRGCLDWQREGLGEPEEVAKATARYRDESDLISGFIEDCCVVRPDVQCKFKVLWDAYNEWRKDANEQHGLTRQKFADRLTERGFEADRGTGNVAIRHGIALRFDGDNDPAKVNSPNPDSNDDNSETRAKGATSFKSGEEGDSIVNSESPAKRGLVNTRYPEVTMNETDSLVWRHSETPLTGINELTLAGESTPDEAPGGGWFEGGPTHAWSTPAEMLADPPAWLITQLERSRDKPGLRKALANTISSQVYGTYERWEEVLPLLDAALVEAEYL